MPFTSEILDTYRSMPPSMRSFWVNWCKENGAIEATDIYDRWFTGTLKRLPQTCYLNWLWTYPPYGINYPPAPNWTAAFPGGLPDPTLFEGGGYLPTEALNTLLMASQESIVLTEKVIPRRSYDTGICRRRRNYSGP
jgi:hypothetical protein